MFAPWSRGVPIGVAAGYHAGSERISMADRDVMIVRFPAGTFNRLRAVLRPAETRTDVVRWLVETEIALRETEADRHRRKQAAQKLAAKLIA